MLDNLIKNPFLKGMISRALRTFCQGLLASIGTTAMIHEVNWLIALSTACMAAIISILTSVTLGIPEGKEQ